MFADNNQISSQQMKRQVFLTFLGIALFLLPGWERLDGREGFVACVAAFFCISIYCLYLVRLAPVYAHPRRYLGKWLTWGMGLLYLCFLVASGGYLLCRMTQIVERYLIQGVPSFVLAVFLLVVCILGKVEDIQRRGRMAEICYPVLTVAFVLLIFGQMWRGSWEWVRVSGSIDWDRVGKGTYGLFGAFAGLALVPFTLGAVRRPAGNYRKIFQAMGQVFLFLFAALAAFRAFFGEKGQVRYGLFTMVLLLFLLLFTLKSIFFYSAHIAGKTHVAVPYGVIALLVFLVSVVEIRGVTIMELYEKWLLGIFVPVFLILAVALGIIVTLTGCGGTEPEKRALPLALGMDHTEQGFEASYAMPNLAVTTGQEKETDMEELNWTETGNSMEEIAENLRKSHEQTLDLSHVEVLLLGNGLTADREAFGEVVTYLQSETTLNEDMPVLAAKQLPEFMEANGNTLESIGKTIKGVIDKQEQKEDICTLRELYRQWSNEDSIPTLARVTIQGKKVEIFME
ncbi:MAG: GerAB/ArcD/ProY family transporter [Lachnospiraceae bacterium]|nr:GerAB/ArcD/ProY family transporter [Lachnospiraceae bacterium]